MHTHIQCEDGKLLFLVQIVLMRSGKHESCNGLHGPGLKTVLEVLLITTINKSVRSRFPSPIYQTIEITINVSSLILHAPREISAVNNLCDQANEDESSIQE